MDGEGRAGMGGIGAAGLKEVQSRYASAETVRKIRPLPRKRANRGCLSPGRNGTFESPGTSYGTTSRGIQRETLEHPHHYLPYNTFLLPFHYKK